MKYLKMRKAPTISSKTLFFLAVLMTFSSILAQDYQIKRHLISDGGERSSFSNDAGFAVTGSIGQTVVGVSNSAVGNYTVKGGFWPADRDLIFSDGFEGSS